jgi:hypothetical protein
MPPDPAALIERARSATADELKAFAHETVEEVLLAILENPHCEEPHVTILLDRLDLPANVLSAIAVQSKWLSSEAVRWRLAAHPRTPKRIAISVVRHLYLFDLVRLSLLPSAPAEIKRLAEEMIVSRVPQLPAGQKLTLARRGSSRVAGALLAEGHPQAIKIALNNAFLTESQVLKVLAKPSVPERAVVAIAQHAKWSSQYNVRMALARNPLTPVSLLLAFLPQLTMQDLRGIEGLQDLPPHLRECIENEVKARNTQLVDTRNSRDAS